MCGATRRVMQQTPRARRALDGDDDDHEDEEEEEEAARAGPLVSRLRSLAAPFFLINPPRERITW